MVGNSTTEDKAKKYFKRDKIPVKEWLSDAQMKWQRAQAPSEPVTQDILLILELQHIYEGGNEKRFIVVI